MTTNKMKQRVAAKLKRATVWSAVLLCVKDTSVPGRVTTLQSQCIPLPDLQYFHLGSIANSLQAESQLE